MSRKSKKMVHGLRKRREKRRMEAAAMFAGGQQKPARRVRERREQKTKERKEVKWPEISARAARVGRVIVFTDKSGLFQRPARRRTWAPDGKTPVLEFNCNWKK